MTDTVDVPVEQHDAAAQARGWLLAAHSATLSTLSVDVDGCPYGSVVPFAPTASGAPVILISRIAAHTRNLQADPRAGLLVREPGRDTGGGDPQAGWRLSVLGRAFRYATPDGQTAPRGAERVEVVDPGTLAEIEARYVARVPRARGYFQAHDFDFWGLTVERARAIGGFGRIGWLEPDALVRPQLPAAARARIVEHMNADHRDALVTCCRALGGHACRDAELLTVDCASCVARADDGTLVAFEFGREIDAAGAREAFVSLLHEARAKLDAMP